MPRLYLSGSRNNLIHYVPFPVSIITKSVSIAIWAALSPIGGHDLDLSWSRKVIDHVTIDSPYAISHWCSIGSEPLSSNRFRDIRRPKPVRAQRLTEAHTDTPQVILHVCSVPRDVHCIGHTTGTNRTEYDMIRYDKKLSVISFMQHT